MSPNCLVVNKRQMYGALGFVLLQLAHRYQASGDTQFLVKRSEVLG